MPKRSHLDNLYSNIQEVKRLVEIHEQISGASRGRRHDVEILNKSGIVLLVACWESYVEDLAALAFDTIFNSAASPDVFPAKVLVLASRDLKEAQDERRVWELAGEGWKTILQRHRATVIDRFVGSFNTPKPGQIWELFNDLLGLSDLTNAWRWHRTTAASAKSRLTELVELRGDIAHRVTTSRSVRKIDVVNAANFIARLAIASSNGVRDFLNQRLGTYPWPIEEFMEP